MASDDVINVSGVVVAINRGGIFDVDTPFGDPPATRRILARCSGKMKQFQIKIVVGDSVEVELSPYDLSQGRIVRRNK